MDKYLIRKPRVQKKKKKFLEKLLGTLWGKIPRVATDFKYLSTLLVSNIMMRMVAGKPCVGEEESNFPKNSKIATLQAR